MNEMMNNMRASMQEHWDMTPEFFDAHTPANRFDLNDGWFEMEFHNAEGEMVFWVEAKSDGDVWHTNFEMQTADNSAAVTSKWNMENGTNTFRVSTMMDFWTTDKKEVEAMVAKFNETGSWEQEK
jgi:hypothetical protein